MRTWHVDGVHRLTWVVLVLLVLALAIFAMAAGFSRLRHQVEPVAPDPGAQAGVPTVLVGALDDFPSEGLLL